MASRPIPHADWGLWFVRGDGLRSVSVPLLWILAEKDRVASMELTFERFRMVQEEGKPLPVALFPDTDHGMSEFVQAPDGSRTYTRITMGTSA